MAVIDVLMSVRDIGIRDASAFSARAAYALTCLTVCWGILTSTGWVQRLTGHHAMRSGHIALASAAVTAALSHALLFRLLDGQILTWFQILVPMSDGTIRHGLGTIALWLMLTVLCTAGLSKWIRYSNWLLLHRLAYVALVLAVIHSWVGAYANGHLATVWLAGVTVTTPVAALLVLRLLPSRTLIRLGVLEGDGEISAPIDWSGRIQVSVNNQRCFRYAYCEAEAPDVFQLREDGRLQFRDHPPLDRNAEVRSAARACPMRAITLTAVTRDE